MGQRIKDAVIAVALVAVTFVALGLGTFKAWDWYVIVQQETFQREQIAKYLDNIMIMQKESINKYCEVEWSKKEQVDEEK